MDSVITFDHFPPLATPLCTLSSHECNLWKNVRLLNVFGCNAEDVIFATDDDQVYGFGRNLSGILGLGHTRDNIKRPELNATLSNKQVVDISCGYRHWIALTANGLCYASGHNQFGQLGIGRIEPTQIPELIQDLSHETITEISCGAFHTLALTSEGQVYTFGTNKFGQLGDDSNYCRWKPRKISLDERVTAISTGINHSLALTSSGRVYHWGLNFYGESSERYDPQNSFVSRPKLIIFSEPTKISKAICGPNHSMLFSIDGSVYTYGENTSGQIGNGSTIVQLTPHKVCHELNKEVKFKDIIANHHNDLSIAVSVGNKYYVWGLVNDIRVMAPMIVTNFIGKSVFDLYASLAKTKVTFKTLVIVGEGLNQFNGHSEEQYSCGYTNGNLSPSLATVPSEKIVHPSKEAALSVSYASHLMSDLVIKSFNDPNTSDLTFRCKDRVIYCHKTILAIRNKKFWTALGSRIVKNGEIVINNDSFESFYALLQYFYGIQPEINEEVVKELQIMAKAFDETKLLEDCSRIVEQMENTVGLANVCRLFEKAVNEDLPDLKKSCVEFAANNFNEVFKTKAFEELNPKTCKLFMLSISELFE